MTGKASRTKGHSFEREMARVFRDLFPDARRGLQYREGTDAPDVEGTPFHIECKVGKRPNIMAAYAQAKSATDGRPVVVVTKRDRCETLVTVNLQYFLEILSGVRHID